MARRFLARLLEWLISDSCSEEPYVAQQKAKVARRSSNDALVMSGHSIGSSHSATGK